MLTFAGNGFGKKTATAGTKINRLIPPNLRGYTRVSKLVATAAGTAHTATALRPLGRTTTTAATAAAGTVINLTADPNLQNGAGNAIAANDLLAIRETDGITRLYTVSSVSTLAITLTAALTAGVASGGHVWSFGVAADTDPRSGEAHQIFALPASATTSFEDRENGIVATFAKDEPILIQDDNATAAGSIDQVSYGYTVE